MTTDAVMDPTAAFLLGNDGGDAAQSPPIAAPAATVSPPASTAPAPDQAPADPTAAFLLGNDDAMPHHVAENAPASAGNSWYGPEGKPTAGNIAARVPAGVVSGTADIIGAPADLMHGASNLERRAFGFAPDETAPLGGSESVKKDLAKLGMGTQALPEPKTATERVAQTAGEVLPSFIVPQAGAEAALSRFPKLANYGKDAISGKSTLHTLLTGIAGGKTAETALQSAAKYAGRGAGALAIGAGGATAEEEAPDKYKPLASLTGQVGTGLGIGLVEAGGKAAWNAGKEGLEAAQHVLTESGNRRAAAEALRGGADNPSQFQSDLNNPDKTAAIVPGSAPTTFQATGDKGVGQMERAFTKTNPEPFQEREDTQNAARVKSIEGLGTEGANADHITDFFKKNLSAIDERATAATAAASDTVKRQADTLTTGQTSEAYGAAMRQGIAPVMAEQKAQTNALWKLVDPDGRLSYDKAPLRQIVQDNENELGNYANVHPEERRLYELVKGGDQTESFKDLKSLKTSLDSLINDYAVPQDAKRRLIAVRDGVYNIVNNAGVYVAHEDMNALAGGTKQVPDTLMGRLEAESNALGKPDKTAVSAGAEAGNPDEGLAAGQKGSVPPASGAKIPPAGGPADAAGSAGIPAAASSDLDHLIDRLRSGEVRGDAAEIRKPILDFLKKRGGINPDSADAAELRAMGVTNRTVPGLFVKPRYSSGMKTGAGLGKVTLDNIPTSEFPIAGDNSGDVIDRSWLLNKIDDEMRRTAKASPEDVTLHDLDSHLRQLGIKNPSRASPQAMKTALLDSVKQEAESMIGVNLDNAEAQEIYQKSYLEGQDFEDTLHDVIERSAIQNEMVHSGNIGETPEFKHETSGTKKAAEAAGASAGPPEDQAQGQAGNQEGSPESGTGPQAQDQPERIVDPEIRERYQAARGATAKFKQTFENGNVGDVMKRGQYGQPFDLENSLVPQKFWNSGKTQAEDVRGYLSASGNPETLRDYAAADLLKRARGAGGDLNNSVLRKWMNDHRAALLEADKAHPGFSDQFRRLSAAQQTLERVTSDMRARKEAYEDSAAKVFLKGDKPAAAAGKLLAKPEQFNQVVLAAKADPAAATGLRRAVLDDMMAKAESNKTAGNTGTKALKQDTFQTWVKKNADTLEKSGLFTKEETESLRAIARDLDRADMSVRSKVRGTPGTAQDLAQVDKHMLKLSMFGRIVSNSYPASIGAGAMAGATTGSLIGPLGTVKGAMLGATAGFINSLRARGIQKINQLIVDALVDPEMARDLLREFPADKPIPVGFQQRMAIRLNQLAVGAAASAALTGPDTPEKASSKAGTLPSSGATLPTSPPTAAPAPAKGKMGPLEPLGPPKPAKKEPELPPPAPSDSGKRSYNNYGRVLNSFARAESSNRPTAKNKHSTASGIYQFLDSTWAHMVRKYGQITGLTMADKNDPDAQRTMASILMRDNGRTLKSHFGRDVTDGELYMAHVLGAGGAKRLIDAKGGNRNAVDMFPEKVIRANHAIFYDRGGRPRSTTEVYNLLDKKVS